MLLSTLLPLLLFLLLIAEADPTAIAYAAFDSTALAPTSFADRLRRLLLLLPMLLLTLLLLLLLLLLIGGGGSYCFCPCCL
jgi:hypothetical protein